ncbi:hypothetical protein BT93_B1630 [Corymbia citriodora subsp. variegata]|nr:hypothetical protein BT93_B1630 [Corymbia citriodora subsp. variegata]
MENTFPLYQCLKKVTDSIIFFYRNTFALVPYTYSLCNEHQHFFSPFLSRAYLGFYFIHLKLLQLCFLQFA